MKKYAIGLIVAILAIASIGWATWSGTVYAPGEGPIKGATISTNPIDGSATSCPGYSLNESNGMEHGVFYYWIKAKMSGYGDGYNYVNDYYDRYQPKTGLDIYLGSPEE